MMPKDWKKKFIINTSLLVTFLVIVLVVRWGLPQLVAEGNVYLLNKKEYSPQFRTSFLNSCINSAFLQLSQSMMLEPEVVEQYPEIKGPVLTYSQVYCDCMLDTTTTIGKRPHKQKIASLNKCEFL